MTVVVGFDGSESSIHALGLGTAEAAFHDTRLRVVCAWDIPESVFAGGFAPEVDVVSVSEGAANETARQASVEIERFGTGVEFENRVVRGHAAELLVEESRSSMMLVVGSRGRGGFRSLLLGSVSDQVAHHASCPVVIVRSGFEQQAAHGVVVVGVDGSESSSDALRFAFREAEVRGAMLRVVCAWQPPERHFFSPMLESVHDEPESALEREETRAHRNWARATIDGMLDELGIIPPAVEIVRRPSEGEPISVLLDESAQADVLVVGARGRGGFASALLGSVSRECAHHARCPVAIVRGESPHPR